MVAWMPYTPGTAARRLRRLLLELIAERGGEETRGAKQRAAEDAGIEQSHFSRTFRGERGIDPGINQLERVVSKMGLRWEYFFGPVEPDSYKSFIGHRYAALGDFLRTPEGKSTSEDERAFLESATFASGQPTLQTYQALLVAYRGAYRGAERRERLRGSLDERLDAALLKPEKRPNPKG